MILHPSMHLNEVIEYVITAVEIIWVLCYHPPSNERGRNVCISTGSYEPPIIFLFT